jgi:hypothetical protein
MLKYHPSSIQDAYFLISSFLLNKCMEITIMLLHALFLSNKFDILLPCHPTPIDPYEPKGPSCQHQNIHKSCSYYMRANLHAIILGDQLYLARLDHAITNLIN